MDGADAPPSSGAKGSAKPKKCVKCEGKGWTFVHSQVISPFCARPSGEPSESIIGWEEPDRHFESHVR